MHHAFVVRAGPDVVGLCVIAVGVCWTVGRPEGGRGCVWAGLSPRLGPGSLELCTHRLTYGVYGRPLWRPSQHLDPLTFRSSTVPRLAR